MVTPDRVLWYEPPGKEEAGTPNLMGVVALVAAIRTLSAIGMKKVLKHEEGLLGYAYERLRWMEGITFYGGIPLNHQQLSQRIGVISFNVEGLFHEDVAEYLAKEGGISVRNGCFCAQPYVQRLLHISKQEMERHMANPSLPHPGMVRASLALYNTREEIDIFLDVLGKLVSSRPRTFRPLRTGSQQF